MKNVLVNRLSEGSSWSAIGAALAVFGADIPQEVLAAMAQIIGGIALVVGFFLRDFGRPN